MPEPAMLTLLGMALLCACLARRVRNNYCRSD
ncbi:MAG: PEP-CTERM sorting domain-containing protein [Thermoguttaceae bacterium]